MSFESITAEIALMNQWFWFGLALILLVIEVLIGGGFIFWIGIAALVTGFIVFAIGSVLWFWQLIAFAILSVLVIVIWWAYLKRNPIQTDRPNLNRRADQYLGRVFILVTPVEQGRGIIQVEDSIWQVSCDEDYPAGTAIKITGSDGVILIGKQSF